MVTAKSAFSLRMPPHVREAADALIGITFSEPTPRQAGLMNHVGFWNTNSALLYLIKAGMKGALIHIERELAKHQEADAVFRELVDFFMRHPAAAHVTAANFAEGSEVRRFIEHLMWAIEDERPSGPEPPSTTANECVRGFVSGGELGDIGLPRKAATEWLTENQDDIFRLTAAKGAIQKALSLRDD
jgi:hypothetical protein